VLAEVLLCEAIVVRSVAVLKVVSISDEDLEAVRFKVADGGRHLLPRKTIAKPVGHVRPVRLSQDSSDEFEIVADKRARYER